jgi:gliding motility-associated-like protein
LIIKPTHKSVFFSFFLFIIPFWVGSQGNVVINEIMINPLPDSVSFQYQSLFDCTTTSNGSEWIELFNDSECDTAYLDCFILSARISSVNSGSFAFPRGTQIAPLGFLLIGGANVSGADFRLPDFCNTDTMCGVFWGLNNDLGYVALYNSSGNVEDAVYWTPAAGQPNLLSTDSSFNFSPCIPASCVINNPLKKANAITPGAEISYAGAKPAQGLTIYRTTDGVGGWQRNATPTPNTCNGVCRPQSSLTALLDSVKSETCRLNNGFLSASASGGIPPYSYEWNIDDRDSFITNLTGGLYTVTVTDIAGCKDTFTINLPNIGNPVTVSIEPPAATIYQGDSILLQLVSNSTLVNILWRPGIRLTCSDCGTTVAYPDESQRYTVYVADIDSCLADTTIYVRVLPDEKSVFVPNVFTPNKDGLNEGLYVRSPRIADMEFRIYDRWGKEVFKAFNQFTPWFGTDENGNNLPAGVYAYYLNATFNNGKSRLFKGNITLVK